MSADSVVHIPGGGCVRRCVEFNGQPETQCWECRKPATQLCDHPLSEGGTCSASMCKEHARRFNGGIDLCSLHWATVQP